MWYSPTKLLLIFDSEHAHMFVLCSLALSREDLWLSMWRIKLKVQDFVTFLHAKNKQRHRSTAVRQLTDWVQQTSNCCLQGSPRVRLATRSGWGIACVMPPLMQVIPPYGWRRREALNKLSAHSSCSCRSRTHSADWIIYCATRPFCLFFSLMKYSPCIDS